MKQISKTSYQEYRQKEGGASDAFWSEQGWSLQGWWCVPGVVVEKIRLHAHFGKAPDFSGSISMKEREQTSLREKVIQSLQPCNESLVPVLTGKMTNKGKISFL